MVAYNISLATLRLLALGLLIQEKISTQFHLFYLWENPEKIPCQQQRPALKTRPHLHPYTMKSSPKCFLFLDRSAVVAALFVICVPILLNAVDENPPPANHSTPVRPQKELHINYNRSTLDAQRPAAFGDIVAEYTFPASSLMMSPTEALIYATIPSQNSIAIIDTNTLAVEGTVFVGSGPANLAFSPAGSKAYIANSTSDFVVVFDTQTRTVENSFLLPEQPQDVVFGSLNRLWVLGETQIFQIDATTGASTGPSIDGFVVYSGALEISADRNTLYYADYGLSPSTMYKYDVSTITPILLLQTPFGTAGSNGQDLALSHNGNFICYATGSGQNNYEIAKFRTSDFAMLGSFNTGPYPRVVTFSPDDQVVYVVHTDGEIDVFDANTFLSLGTMFASGEGSELTVDSTGRYLFAGYLDPFWGFAGTRVFDTGRSAGPTPTPSPTPTATPTPTPCTGRCAPTPRPRPTPAPRP
jgi:YVTN family beta-propeller protein